ncbi:MAG: aminoacyl-tRNA hydrolase [Patescibacteria group bacterium]
MKLIIGLGNPGKIYQNTWHNLGFMVLDELKNTWNLKDFKLAPKLQAEVCEGKVGREKIVLAKPATFMNNSGVTVFLLLKYYKAKISDLIVIHDDIALPLGKIRLVIDSSAGGHNGVKSIIEHLSAQNFIRLKVGAKTPILNHKDVPDYVLDKISSNYKEEINANKKRAASAVCVLLEDGLESAMNQYN